MLQKRTTTYCWGLGLSEEQAEQLREFLGKEYSLELWGKDYLPTEADMERFPPYLVWLSSKARANLASRPEEQTWLLSHVPKALLLDEGYTKKELESAADSGFTEIVRPPMTKARVRSILRRAMEVQDMRSDILSMTRNILLERELLERKNELMNFLVNFLTKTSGSLDLQHILQSAFGALGLLFPVRALNAVFWGLDECDEGVDLYLFAEESTDNFDAWKKVMLKQAESIRGCKKLRAKNTYYLELPDIRGDWAKAKPRDGHVINLPVSAGGQMLGMLSLVTDMESSLGRDQAMALDSALQHLGICVRNTMYFSRVQTYADYDALTGVHSRRHFGDRLNQEMDKFSRYGQPFSLVILDIDHFKAVNDTYGHLAGDKVLQGMASIIKKTIRASDYCARIGGEEFVVLLPHTDSVKAVTLAERLRNNVAGHTFMLDDGPMYITISLGIAQAEAKETMNCDELMRVADNHLYKAKQNGRNQVCDGFELLRNAL